ncbi:outer membrane receptor protein involved in Fe transport [Povalibacter uvarum]|uniref:Outer membrane receptor protein involved in Fe transport n=1 Tax=Povalibacter uvarum TaxID=732238 RepID=A0A841HVQ5_9GAMM|nr:TonB-dependent receptor [Povalibacter uvarum]MBB6096339.1 outer membrane receptor protein involved in Fe transport [Povalibacter uvarum]
MRIAIATAVAACLMASMASAEDAKLYNLNISRQPLDAALQELARQTGLQVGRFSDAGQDEILVGPLSGDYAADKALEVLLSPSGFTWRALNDRAYIVLTPSDLQPAPAGERGRETVTLDRVSTTQMRPIRLAQLDTSAAPPSGAVTVPQRAAAAASADAEEAPVAEVIVTGSRIRTTNLVSSSPVTTVNQESLKQTGTQSVEAYLNTLPQLVAGNTKSSNVFGDADATSTLNLRGLGAKRSLVLVNGKRFIASGPGGTVDVNNIPASIVDRVEIVTGGGSAVYGSDAMAGVVNFILKDKFDGMEVEGQYGISGEGDASVWSASTTIGGTGERSSGWLHISHEERDLLRGNQRELSRYALTDNGTTFVRTGSASRRGGTLLAIPTPNGTGGFTNRDYALDDLVPRPYVAAQDAFFDATGDYAIQTPLERTNVYGRATFDATDNATVYLETTYNRVFSAAALSPSAPNVRQTYNAPAMPVNASWISPEIRALLNARPNPNAPFAVRFLVPDSFPKREISFTRDIFRGIGGLKGEWDSGWAWDVSYSYSHLNTTEVQKGDVSRRMIVEASTPDPNDPTRCANGNPACSLITSLTDWTPEQVAYLRSDNVSTISGTEEIAAAQITGDLFTLPAGAVSTAFGTEYRQVSSQDNPAPIVRDFISAGFGERSATSGSFDVWEAYGEAIVPLIADKPFMDYVGLEVAARYSDYSLAGGVNTYKAGGEWRFNPTWRLRGVYQRAVRAPNINELFGGATQTFPQTIEPCSASANPTGAVRDLCIAQGIPADQIGVYQQNGAAISGLLVSNPDLEPEESDTVTLGVVYTPEALPRLNVTLDYYDIKISNAIERLAGGAIGTLNACFASLDINSQYCQTIRRSPSNYEIADFRVPLANVGALRTSGIDLASQYAWDFDFGFGGAGSRLHVSALATWVEQNTFQANPDAPVIDRVGTVGGDTAAIPEWRANTDVTWVTGDMRFTWSTQYLSSVKDRKYANALAAGSANPTAGITNPEVPAYWYHNFNVAYDLGKYSVYGGVRNAFDKQAPLLSSPIEGNTDQNTYDVIGRYFYLGASVEF